MVRQRPAAAAAALPDDVRLALLAKDEQIRSLREVAKTLVRTHKVESWALNLLRHCYRSWADYTLVRSVQRDEADQLRELREERGMSGGSHGGFLVAAPPHEFVDPSDFSEHAQRARQAMRMSQRVLLLEQRLDQREPPYGAGAGGRALVARVSEEYDDDERDELLRRNAELERALAQARAERDAAGADARQQAAEANAVRVQLQGVRLELSLAREALAKVSNAQRAERLAGAHASGLSRAEQLVWGRLVSGGAGAAAGEKGERAPAIELSDENAGQQLRRSTRHGGGLALVGGRAAAYGLQPEGWGVVGRAGARAHDGAQTARELHAAQPRAGEHAHAATLSGAGGARPMLRRANSFTKLSATTAPSSPSRLSAAEGRGTPQLSVDDLALTPSAQRKRAARGELEAPAASVAKPPPAVERGELLARTPPAHAAWSRVSSAAAQPW